MSTEEEVLKIRVEAEAAELERLRSQMQSLGGDLKNASAQFGNASPQVLKLARDMDTLAAKTLKAEQAIGRAGGKLSGMARSKAMGQAGIGMANLIQDVAQGGPKAGINNLLGMAGNQGIMSLVGGIGGATAALGTMAVVAGGAFLVINSGLKQAQLGWSDFGDVVGNLAPITAASEAFAGFYETSGLNTVVDATGRWIHNLANVTLGWDNATAAVKAHNEQLAQVGQKMRDAAEAQKTLAKYQSAEQEQTEERGKKMAQSLAEMGGAGGASGLATEIAQQSLGGRFGEIVKDDPYKDEKGKTKYRDISRGAKEIERLMVLMGKVEKGDTHAAGTLRQDLAGLKRKPNLGSFDQGRGYEHGSDEANKEDEAESKRRSAKTKQRIDKLTADSTRNLQRSYDAAAATGRTPDEAALTKQMVGMGVDEDRAKQIVGEVAKNLATEFKERVGKLVADSGGKLTQEQARAKIVKEEADKRRGERDKQLADAKKIADKNTRGMGVDTHAEDAMTRMTIAGMSAQQQKAVLAQGFAQQQYGKMSDEDANALGKAFAEEQVAKFGDKMAGMAAPELKPSQTFQSGLEFLQNMQDQPLLKVNEQQLEQLKVIAEQRRQAEGNFFLK
jgi:hypothetical protein